MTDSSPTVQQLFDMSGRVALVTGASGYLGAAFADALAEAGCRVVVGSRDVAKAQTTAATLGGPAAGNHVGVALDQMDEASLEQGFADAVAAAGQIDVLVNNGHELLSDDWSTVSGAQFSRQLANATGYFLLARLLREHVVKRDATGSVIMLGSMYGLVGSYPDAYKGVAPASSVAYHTLKGGIVHMTRHLAVYWAKDGVRVNCLSPGPFPAPKAPREMVVRLETHSPLARMGVPHELKGALLLLASDAGSYITGHNLVVDGGWTAW